MLTKKILSFFATCVIFFAMALFLLHPARYGASVLEGVSLWAVSVLPATFPFLFLTALFTRLSLFQKLSKAVSPLAGKVFRISGESGCAALLAAVSGYPVGARSVLDLYERGRLGRDEAFRLSCLATTSGPMFLVGTVGSGMWNTPALGWILLLCHFLGVWFLCFGLRFFAKKTVRERPALLSVPQGNALYDSLYSSVVSILCVGGSIALFCAFGQMIADAISPVFPIWGTNFVRGLIEMTTGCALFAADPSPLSLGISCFFVTFGGLCVLCQQIAYLSRAQVNIPLFLLIKTLQGALAGALCFGIACLVM